jgi:maleylacetoacetate isomerase/maleylpyruvate isomerase
MENFILYSYFRSSTAYRVRIALNIKDVKYTQKAVHLLEDGGQQYKPEYLTLNPTAEVPTLIHNGKILSQSFAIIEYLDEIIHQNPLFPKDPFERAKIRQICENINCGIHPLTNLKVMNFLNSEMEVPNSSNEKWQQHWISKGLSALEKIIQSTAGSFAFGEKITCADIFIIPQIFSAKRFGVTTENYPTLTRVNENCIKLQAFLDAHPSRQPDTP